MHLLSNSRNAFDDCIFFPSDQVANACRDQNAFVEHLSTYPIWNRYHPSQREGDTGVGYTFEQLLGVQENNRSEPDLHGYEVKVTTGTCEITLFTKKPTGPKGAERYLIETFGQVDEAGTRRFNTNLLAGRTSTKNGLPLTVWFNEPMGELHLLTGAQIVGFWTLEDLQQASEKLRNLLFCRADKTVIGGVDHFRYSRVNILRDFDVSRLIDCIRASQISVQFRMKQSPEGVIRNNGTAFRIRSESLRGLYGTCTDYAFDGR